MSKTFRQGVVAAAAVVAGLSTGVVGTALVAAPTVAFAEETIPPTAGDLGVITNVTNFLYDGTLQTHDKSKVIVKDKLATVIPADKFNLVYKQGTSAVAGAKNVGTYTVAATAVAGATGVSGTTEYTEFQVLPKLATITARNATIFKGDALPSKGNGLRAEVDGEVDGETLDYSLTIKDSSGNIVTDSTKPGSYVIEVGLTEGGVNANYSVTKNSGVFTIIDTDAPFIDVDSKTPHHDDISWMAKRKLTAGWPADGGREFRGENLVLRQDMAAFLYRLAGCPSTAITSQTKAKFYDVDESTPHCDAIWWCAQVGLTEGWQEGAFCNFHGDWPVLRQDMAAFLHRFATLNNVSGYAKDEDFFVDVDDTTPHADDIGWLAGNGIARGWETDDDEYEFRGGQPVIRQDISAFLRRLNEVVRDSTPASTTGNTTVSG